MKKTTELYYELTNVDLEKQKYIWNERGKGYYGEYLVFQELFYGIKGTSKILMNLQIPTANERNTEIDLILIHENGIYVFEIKHYKGTIYGKVEDKIWTQYFRTSKNNIFKNPVLQNEYHIQALKRIIPDIPIFSVILFSNNECNIQVSNSDKNLIITDLTSLKKELFNHFEWHRKICNIDEIDKIFRKLEVYSPIRSKTIVLDDESEVPIYNYIHNIKNTADEFLKKEKNDYLIAKNNFEKEQHNLKIKWLRALITIVVSCLFIINIFCQTYKSNIDEKLEVAISKLQEMEKKFEQIDTSNFDNTQLVNSIIQVSNIKLNMSFVAKNTATFSCTLTNIDEEYGILLNENTTFIIMMNDGRIQEYNMFGPHLTYNESVNRLSGTEDKLFWNHSGTLKELHIYNITDINEIDYIKITNISLWELNKNNNKPFANGLEIELYSK